MAFNWLEFLFDDHDLAREFWVHEMEDLNQTWHEYYKVDVAYPIECCWHEYLSEFIMNIIQWSSFKDRTYIANALYIKMPAKHIHKVFEIPLDVAENIKKQYSAYCMQFNAPRHGIHYSNRQKRHDWDSNIFTLVVQTGKIKEQSSWTI